ncbi:MAG: acetyl-CoA carboxylase biotin carboxyl carrier protein subunit [Flavobacteriales bacterium]
MIKAKVNQSEFEVEFVSENQVLLNNESKNLDIISLSDSKKHLILDNKSFSIEHVSFDKEKKEAVLKVNNNTYKVELKDKYDLLLKELGMSNMSAKVVKDIKAPMPGLVVSIEVEKGQEVKVGDAILILEAMKMENVLKSPIDGVIKSIKAEKATTVDKNTVLIEFE